MHIHFVSFIGLAPGAEKLVKRLGKLSDLVKRQEVLSKSALELGEVDYVHLYSRDKLTLTDYYKKNKALLDQPVGCGYWAWKPYIILETLAKIKPNDYVIYCDVGKPTKKAKQDHGNIITTSLKPLVEWADRNKGMLPGVYLSNHGQAKRWIKRDAFTLMECDTERYHQMPTIQAGYTVWKNTPEVIEFLQEWQELNLDPRLISDQENVLGKENYAEFEKNCHDQATLTLLCEKKGVSVFGDRGNQFFGFRNINFITHEAGYQNAQARGELVFKKINNNLPLLPNYATRWVELFFQYRRNEKLIVGFVGVLTQEQKKAWQIYLPNSVIETVQPNNLRECYKRFDFLLALSLGDSHYNESLLLKSFQSLKHDGVALFSPLPNSKSQFELVARRISNDEEFPSSLFDEYFQQVLQNPKIPNSRNPIFVSGRSKNGQIEAMCIMFRPSEKFMNNESESKSKHISLEPKRSVGLPPLPKVRQIALLVDDANYSQVDLYAQHILRVLPDDPHANLACAWVANKFELNVKQRSFFQQAMNGAKLCKRSLELIAADLHIDLLDVTTPKLLSKKNIEAERKLHIAKAWGFGFGSEMSALMGQAYLAEICNRELVVHWGSNFLYRPEPGDQCVFDCYFERFNDLTINSVNDQLNLNDVYPPKWDANNIYQENVNKRKGAHSKLSALYFLNRNESVTVSDYYTGVVHIKPWIDPSLPLSELSLDEAYRYLAKKYLQPKKAIMDEVDAFIDTQLSEPFIAVHARGSDKDEGYRALTSIPGQILQCAKQRLEKMPQSTKLFLMTDDMNLLKVYQKEFGERLVQTDCQRCDTQVGVHYDQNTNKLQAGKEMLIDMLVAAKAQCFIGLGLSNPSQLITYFGDFSADNYILFGENRLKQFNTHLYKTISVT